MSTASQAPTTAGMPMAMGTGTYLNNHAGRPQSLQQQQQCSELTALIIIKGQNDSSHIFSAVFIHAGKLIPWYTWPAQSTAASNLATAIKMAAKKKPAQRARQFFGKWPSPSTATTATCRT